MVPIGKTVSTKCRTTKSKRQKKREGREESRISDALTKRVPLLGGASGGFSQRSVGRETAIHAANNSCVVLTAPVKSYVPHNFASSCLSTSSSSPRSVSKSLLGSGCSAKRSASAAAKICRTTPAERHHPFRLGQQWRHIAAHERARLRRIMRRTGDAHRIDRARRETRSVTQRSRLPHGGPFAPQCTTRATTDQDFRVRLVKAPSPVPEPKARTAPQRARVASMETTPRVAPAPVGPCSDREPSRDRSTLVLSRPPSLTP